MLDRERVLAKLDELEGYLRELEAIAPRNLAEYRRIEKKRACERLVQIAVESVIALCQLFVSGLRLGLPGEEDDLFQKLEQAGVLSPETVRIVKRMKGCRNILVHEYGGVDDELIFDMVRSRRGDFTRFASEIRAAVARY